MTRKQKIAQLSAAVALTTAAAAVTLYALPRQQRPANCDKAAHAWQAAYETAKKTNDAALYLKLQLIGQRIKEACGENEILTRPEER